MITPACGRLLFVALAVSVSLGSSDALAQSYADVIQRLESEGAHLREKLDKLDTNAQTILTLQVDKDRLAYAEDANRAPEYLPSSARLKEIDQQIEKLKRENQLLRKDVNARLAYVVSLAVSSTAMIHDAEKDPFAYRDKRAEGTCLDSGKSAGRTIVAPFSPPPRRSPSPPSAQIQSGGAGIGPGSVK